MTAPIHSERILIVDDEDQCITAEIENRGHRDRLERLELRDRVAQRRLMEAHTEIGHRILAGSDVELLDLAALMALTHHERPDGTGYPAGLAGDAIPIEGRITAVADVFDALTSDRVYRPAFQPDEAREMMERERGTQFDAELLDLFFGSFDDVLAIRRSADTANAEQMLARALAHVSAGARPARRHLARS